MAIKEQGIFWTTQCLKLFFRELFSSLFVVHPAVLLQVDPNESCGMARSNLRIDRTRRRSGRFCLMGSRSGMGSLHSLRIFHRELKCANVLLDDDRRSWLRNIRRKQCHDVLTWVSVLPCTRSVVPAVKVRLPRGCGFVFDHILRTGRAALGHDARNVVQADQYMKGVADGDRPIPRLASDGQRLLLASMWSENPFRRPTFWKLCPLLRDVSRRHWIEGTDTKEFPAHKGFLDAEDNLSPRPVTVAPHWLMKSSKWEAVDQPDVLMSDKVSFLIAHLTTQDDNARAELQDALHGCFAAHGRLVTWRG
jgi:serine/threonine protein kinase